MCVEKSNSVYKTYVTKYPGAFLWRSRALSSLSRMAIKGFLVSQVSYNPFLPTKGRISFENPPDIKKGVN